MRKIPGYDRRPEWYHTQQAGTGRRPQMFAWHQLLVGQTLDMYVCNVHTDTYEIYVEH